jgi:hypothetical protein
MITAAKKNSPTVFSASAKPHTTKAGRRFAIAAGKKYNLFFRRF